MGALADAIYQRTIDDYESSIRRAKIKNFLGLSAGVAVVLGMSFCAVNLVTTTNHNYHSYQSRLKYVAEHPLVYDGGNVEGCNVKYIETAHNSGNGVFRRDVYEKSECDGQVSVNLMNAVKENIQFNRKKLLSDPKHLEILKNMK